MQLNKELPLVCSGKEESGSTARIKKNKKWPTIYFLEVPSVLQPRTDVVAPATFIQDLAIAKAMMLWAAKNSKCRAFWSNGRKQWLLVSNEPFEPNLESFCGRYGQVQKLRNRQCDYAAVRQLLN